MAEETIRVGLAIPVETNADQASASVDSLYDSIKGSTDAIRDMQSMLKNLRGKTDEVKSAKAALKAKIDAERDSVEKSTIAIAKKGTSLAKLARDEKAAKEQAARAAREQELRTASLKKESDAFAAAGRAAAGFGVAIATAAIAASVQLGKFIVKAADARRAAGLNREAWLDSSKSAKNMGDHIDQLARKLPIGAEKLDEIGLALAKQKIGGKAWVESMGAIGTATAALGDEAGGKIQDLITRGRQFGKMRINPAEMLEGFGKLKFDDIAAALAEGMHTNVEEARKALVEGRVPIEQGAKAIKVATEKQFGSINARKMLSLETLGQKASESFDRMTKNVNLEPLSKAFGRIGAMFDEGTVKGHLLQSIVSKLGNALVGALAAAEPFVEAVMGGLMQGAMDAYGEIKKTSDLVSKAFGDKSAISGAEALAGAFKLAGYAARYFGKQIESAIVLGAALGAGIAKAREGISAIGDAFTSAKGKIAGLDWAQVGADVIGGLVKGLADPGSLLSAATSKMGDAVIGSLKKKLGIASPSRVAEKEIGRQIPAGTARGIDRGASEVNQAAQSMAGGAVASTGKPVGASTAAGGGGRAVVNVTINMNGGGGNDGAAKSLLSQSFRAQFVQMLEEACISAGIAVQG